MLSSLPDPVRRLTAVVCRASTICVLTPFVILFSLSTLAGLALVGTVRLARSSTASLRLDTGHVGAEVQLYARAAAEVTDGVAARQPA